MTTLAEHSVAQCKHSVAQFKDRLDSERIYEVIVSPKMATKNFKDFCPGSLLEGRANFWLVFWEKR